MQMAKVRGTVVGTQKLPSMTGVKLLLLQFLDENGELLPKYEVAADSVGAGLEEWVLVNRGSAARQEEGHHNRPLDAMVVAIIDTVTVDNRRIYGEYQ